MKNMLTLTVLTLMAFNAAGATSTIALTESVAARLENRNITALDQLFAGYVAPEPVAHAQGITTVYELPLATSTNLARPIDRVRRMSWKEFLRMHHDRREAAIAERILMDQNRAMLADLQDNLRPALPNAAIL